MSLEFLANELFFDLFEYLSSVDLFHAFNGLNSRFDSLLLSYFQSNEQFDFRFIYKDDLNLLRRRYLPLFIDQIKSISLSNDDPNPHEIDFFLSRLYPLHRFVNLQSITFSHIYSGEKILRILDDIKHISHLTKLHFKQCQIDFNPTTVWNIINDIWRLPHLTDCHLDFISDTMFYFLPSSAISCSLKHLSIESFECDLTNLLHLYEHTPYIEDLSVKISASSNDDPQLPLLHSITTLKLKCQTIFHLIQTLLRKMPNLLCLTVETHGIEVNGQKWQDIIQRYLPKLKVFNLKMSFQTSNYADIEEELDRIINSYRTSFWIDQHQWFVRCLTFSVSSHHIIDLHTIPYRFEQYWISMIGDYRYRSTCPVDDQHLTYKVVHKLDYDCHTLDEINFTKIQFSNLRHLTLTFPYDDKFRSLVPQLDHLIFLNIRMNTQCYDENDLIQLQTILDQTPRLYYLKFHSWTTLLSKSEHKNRKNVNTKMPPYASRSASVRYLDLQGRAYAGATQYYNDQQCSSLIQSSLGSQCEFLLIEVDQPTNIIDLVTKMKRLRTLNVRCRDRKNHNDELIKWLKSRLPSTCTFAKDAKCPDDIRLWIR